MGAVEIPGYEDFRVIGEGGFATVYRATQPAFGRDVAVKVLDRRPSDERVLAIFAKECRAVGRLSGHPHVVEVYETGTTSGGQPYLVMQLLPGGSLADAIADGRPLPLAEAVARLTEVADILSDAHALGVLHRDIKPANVMIDGRGRARLVDFGIARVVDAGGTTTGAAVTGTIAFMAPELLSGDKASTASDIYALGLTLATVLHGHNPLVNPDADHVAAVMARILAGDPPQAPAGTPAAIASLIAQCTAREPSERPSSAGEVQQRLAEAGHRTAVQVSPPSSSAPGRASDHTVVGPPPPVVPVAPRSREAAADLRPPSVAGSAGADPRDLQGSHSGSGAAGATPDDGPQQRPDPSTPRPAPPPGAPPVPARLGTRRRLAILGAFVVVAAISMAVWTIGGGRDDTGREQETSTSRSSSTTAPAGTEASPGPASTTTTAPSIPAQTRWAGSAPPSAAHQTLLDNSEMMFVRANTCRPVDDDELDVHNVYPQGPDVASIDCEYGQGARIVFSLFASDAEMEDFFEERLEVRDLAPGMGSIGPEPPWALRYEDDPERGTGSVYGTYRSVDGTFRSDIGFIREGLSTYAYSFAIDVDFPTFYAWWSSRFGSPAPPP